MKEDRLLTRFSFGLLVSLVINCVAIRPIILALGLLAKSTH